MALLVGGYETLFTIRSHISTSISLYNKGNKCILYFIKPVTKVSVTRLSSVLYFIKPVTKVSATRLSSVLLYLIDMRVSVIR